MLTNVGNVHVVKIGPELLDLTKLATAPSIVPDTTTSNVVFTIGNAGKLKTDNFNTFAAFVTVLAGDLASTATPTTVDAVAAEGQYDSTTNVFTAQGMAVLLSILSARRFSSLAARVMLLLRGPKARGARRAKRGGDLTMAVYVKFWRAQCRASLFIGIASVALLGVAACSKAGGGEDQMTWAHAALERNDRIEVVASDPQASTFTVRVKETGELRMIRLDQVIAGPTGSVGSPVTAPPAAATAAVAQPESPDASTAATAAAPGNGVAPPSAQPSATPGNDSLASQGPPASAPGASVTRQAADSSAPRTGFRPDPAPTAEVPNPNSDVASITPGGRTLEAGPGYVIKTASKQIANSSRGDRERSSTTSAAIERRHDPIICQGARLLQIDNRNLEFDGDAVSAQDGCEIHITNSHITAKGIGVSARAANVHIDNSQIEGDSASVDAEDGAQVYASSSTFKGMSRRLDKASFHDLGGNVFN